MCGISGFISQNNFLSADDIELMTNIQNHRGPDNKGIFSDDNACLGHNRLSIIDLSPSAHQPMFSHNGRYAIVFNGEIYNYKELAKEVNCKWKTHSDTEVILEAFSKYGYNFISRLNGMFAMAIYDTQEKSLLLARDRIGIKPLFYFFDNGNLIFSSELKAIVKILENKKSISIDKTAINLFLHLGYIPQPHTVYNEIKKFPAGCYAIFHKSDLKIEKYWRLKNHIKNTVVKDENEAKKHLKKLIEESVSKRLMSDVPYGTFLSGGIDSSLVTAIAQKVNKKAIKTFSIGFKESKYNEANYAKKVAEHLKTDHHEFTVSYADAMDLIESLDDQFDEPFADSSAIPTMLVSKMARQYVTMTLSGDGGDELFHGYGAYLWANKLSRPYMKLIHNPASKVLSLMPSKYERVSKLLNYKTNVQLESHIFSQEQYFFSQKELKSLILPNNYSWEKLPTKLHEFGNELTPAEIQAIFDINYYLKDDLLVKVDRSSMKHSLETRVPLLDHNIVEYAVNIAPGLKIKNGIQKYILKQVLYDYLPQHLFERPKWGFSIPLNIWMLNELKYLIDKYLSKNIVERHGIVSWQYVSDILNGFTKRNKNYLYNRLWLLIVLHKWLEKHR